MSSYADFLNSLSFTDQPAGVFTGTFTARLDKNNIPELALSEAVRQAYIHDVLWAIKDINDITYLKSNKVEFWDPHVAPASAIYGEYTPVERIALHGTPEIAELFAEYIGDYIKDEPAEGWIPEYDSVINEDHRELGNGERRESETVHRVKRWLHPKIHELGHRWLDLQKAGGGPKELIMGSLLPSKAPVTRAGIENFTFAPVGTSIAVHKQLPFEECTGFLLDLVKHPIAHEALVNMMLEARAAESVEAIEAQFDQLSHSFPRAEFVAHLWVAHCASLRELEMAVFQASVMCQMLTASLGILATSLTVHCEALTTTEEEVARKGDLLTRETNNAGHLFIDPKGLQWIEYQYPHFQFL